MDFEKLIVRVGAVVMIMLALLWTYQGITALVRLMFG